MKRFVAGIIVGAVLSFSVSVYGAEIQSFIGKEVQGQTTVYKNGEKLDTAIIVDGKSYAPTRSIGEAAGYSVSFEEGEIHLNSEDTVVIPNIASATSGSSLEQINERIAQIQEGAESRQKRIAFSEEMVRKYTEALNDPESTASDKQHASAFLPTEEKRLAELRDKDAELKSELAVLEAEKSALEAQ